MTGEWPSRTSQMLQYGHQVAIEQEIAQDPRLVQAAADRMVVELLQRLIADEREPVPGTIDTRVEQHTLPGAALPQSWWERLLRRPVRRGPGHVYFTVYITLMTLPTRSVA